VVRPNSAYAHGEKTWESFINKLSTRDIIFHLILTREFIFPSNTSRLQHYSFSFCTVTYFSFALTFFFLLVLLYYVTSFIYRVLQYKHYSNYKMILVIGCLKNMINPYRNWLPWYRTVLDPSILKTHPSMHRIWILFVVYQKRKLYVPQIENLNLILGIWLSTVSAACQKFDLCFFSIEWCQWSNDRESKLRSINILSSSLIFTSTVDNSLMIFLKKSYTPIPLSLSSGVVHIIVSSSTAC